MALWLLDKRTRGRDLQGVHHVSEVPREDCQSCFRHDFSNESGIHSLRDVYIVSLPFFFLFLCESRVI